MRRVQGIEGKVKGAGRFVCLGTYCIIGGIPRGSQRFEIPDGAEYAKARKGKMNFYKGEKPEPDGYAPIPEDARIAWLPDYKDRGKHLQYGEVVFE